jgi:hypothetical protein
LAFYHIQRLHLHLTNGHANQDGTNVFLSVVLDPEVAPQERFRVYFQWATYIDRLLEQNREEKLFTRTKTLKEVGILFSADVRTLLDAYGDLVPKRGRPPVQYNPKKAPALQGIGAVSSGNQSSARQTAKPPPVRLPVQATSDAQPFRGQPESNRAGPPGDIASGQRPSTPSAAAIGQQLPRQEAKSVAPAVEAALCAMCEQVSQTADISRTAADIRIGYTVRSPCQ